MFDEITPFEVSHTEQLDGSVLKLSKVDLLSKIQRKAPYLFNAVVSSPSPKKRKRKGKARSVTRERESSAAALQESYPDPNIEKSLQSEGKAWSLDPLGSLEGWDRSGALSSHPDSMVRIYGVLNQGIQKNFTNIILKRIHCVTFCQLHEKRRKVDDIATRIHESLNVAGEDKEYIKQKIYKILETGYKWQKIVSACESLPGVLCLLGKASA